MAERTGRGVVLAHADAPPVVEEIALDGPGPGEVQVRITASGVCHTDLHVLRAGGWGHRDPILLGHEGAGVVEEVGEGVETPSPGDTVVLAWRAPCGVCATCTRGEPRRCPSPLRARRRLRIARTDEMLTQTLLTGTFATRTIVHAGAAIPVPPELPVEQACLIGCAVATGFGSVLHTSRPWPGASVAVIGCGAVGLSAIQGARHVGASRIVAVDVEPRKLEWARSFGATDAVDASSGDPVDAVRELTEGDGVDFAYEAVGRPATLEQAARMLAHGGTATLIGVPADDAQATFPLGGRNGLFTKRATVRISHGGDHLPAEDFPLIARLALEGELDLAGMVSARIRLEDVDSAFEEMVAGNVIRSVIVL